MRIIGGRDYYDGAGYGIDTQTLFVRKPALIEAKASPLHLSHQQSNGKYITIFEAFVAGNLYPAAVVSTSDVYARTEPKIVYKLEDLDVFDLHPYVVSKIKDAFSCSTHRLKNITDWAIQNNITTAISGARFSTVSNRYILHSYDCNDTLVNADTLKLIQLQRVLPPAQAHQAIASWVGGVLSSTPQTMILSNESRIRKAGFDKHSFRNSR